MELNTTEPKPLDQVLDTSYNGYFGILPRELWDKIFKFANPKEEHQTYVREVCEEIKSKVRWSPNIVWRWKVKQNIFYYHLFDDEINESEERMYEYNHRRAFGRRNRPYWKFGGDSDYYLWDPLKLKENN